MKRDYNRSEQIIYNSRVLGLDILRACAILFVVIEHSSYVFNSGTLNRINHNIFGFDGVSVFFVLSGFLIGGVLIKTLEKKQCEKKVLLNFWVRRWFRTIPNYFLILTILLLLNVLFTEGFSFDIKFPLTFFTFTQNLFYPHPTFFPEAWSLSIEEWFYLLIPPIILFFIFLKISVKTSILYTALGILVIITLFRFYQYHKIPQDALSDFEIKYWDLRFRKQVFTRLDSLMFGVIGAFLQNYYSDYWLKYKKTLLYFGLFLFLVTKYLGLLMTITYNSLYYCVFSFSVTSFAILLSLPFLSNFRSSKTGLIHKSITRISLISYSMYLINLSVVQFWILNKIPWNIISMNRIIIGAIKYSLYWSLTIILSMIIYKYFEVPTMNLRDNKMVKRWLGI